MKNPFQMIKQGVTTTLVNESGPFPRCQATYNGKTTDFFVLNPYGLDASPPIGSLVTLYSIQGQESVKFGIIADIDDKDTSKTSGEVRLRNAVTKAFIKLNRNKGIEIDAINGIVTINSNDIQLGSLTTQTLVNALFITAVYDIHTHPQQGGGTTSPPNQPGIPGTHTTIETKAS